MTQAHKSGGCQCGRIRYRAQVSEATAYLCHCRMCQKATGGFAATFVALPAAAVAWESEPDWFRSSPVAERPFCSVCGSPLGFRFDGSESIDLTFGSFDDPASFIPALHAGAESLHEAWLDTTALPRQRSEQTQSVVDSWRKAGLEVPD